MGWTGVYQRVDDPQKWLLDEARYWNGQMLDSAMVGPVFYGAFRKDGGDRVIGIVILTERQGREFRYKEMDESMGPNESKCPKHILEKLTPLTDDVQWTYAKAWRERCWSRFAPPRNARREADRIDGYDRDDLGESPDF